MTRIAVLILLSASAVAGASPGADEELLKRQTRELLDAIAPGEWAVWDRLLDDAVVYAAEDGRVMTKAQLKEELQPMPSWSTGSITPRDFVVRLHGDVAIVSYEGQEQQTLHGQTVRPRYHTTDTWRKKGGRWRLLASQVVALPDPPPAITLPREALAALTGVYQLGPGATVTIKLDGEQLVAEREGRPKQTLAAETETVFFAASAPRVRKIFVRDRAGKVTHFFDRREGHDLKWTRIGDSP
jgi:ketosteroid isomerase-like protein